MDICCRWSVFLTAAHRYHEDTGGGNDLNTECSIMSPVGVC